MPVLQLNKSTALFAATGSILTHEKKKIGILSALPSSHYDFSLRRSLADLTLQMAAPTIPLRSLSGEAFHLCLTQLAPALSVNSL